MARILCCWEIGDGHGHVRNLMAVAELLREAGHTAIFALSASQTTASHLVQQHGWAVEHFVLPHYPSLNQYLQPMQVYRANSFLDVLGLHAFDDSQRLQPLAQRLADIIFERTIDVVVAETAPVAMLAAKLANRPCIGIGTSFGLPEMREGFAPYAQFDHWPNTPLFTDAKLLATIHALSDRRFTSTAEALQPTRLIPFCYPALDHYGIHRSLTHRGVGPIWSMPWQEPVHDLRGFAYLQQAYPAVNDLVSAIRLSGIPFKVYVRNGSYKSTGNMQVITDFDLSEQLQQASFVLHHGSAGMAQAALSAGIPQMCMPYHVENITNAYLLQQLGVSKAIGHQQQRDFMQFMLEDDDNRLNAAQVVAKQLAQHANEFRGAHVAAAAIDDLL
jgi:UDP:flavonoid glycosyltransferase YjiC (YdhE family)